MGISLSIVVQWASHFRRPIGSGAGNSATSPRHYLRWPTSGSHWRLNSDWHHRLDTSERWAKNRRRTVIGECSPPAKIADVRLQPKALWMLLYTINEQTLEHIHNQWWPSVTYTTVLLNDDHLEIFASTTLQPVGNWRSDCPATDDRNVTVRW